MEIQDIHNLLGGIEKKLDTFAAKATEEQKIAGTVSAETKSGLEKIGNEQKELAQRLLMLEQKGGHTDEPTATKGWGEQFTASPLYKGFIDGSQQKARFEVKNTLTGSDTTVAPDRRTDIVAGAAQTLTMESLFPHVLTTAGAIEYTKETAFTNNAAETAEAAQKPESAITWALVNMPISTVAHWIKISRQLAADAPALKAYVDSRMRYGVNRRVETQLVSGNGVAPNIGGILLTGNFTAHGYANAALGSTLKTAVLLRMVMGDLQAAGYAPDAVVLSPADWATMEISLFTTAAGQRLASMQEAGTPMMFGMRIVVSPAMTAGYFAMGNFAIAGTIYEREGVTVDMSESDSDNFTKNLITIRAERRLALAIEVPAAIRAGVLAPA